MQTPMDHQVVQVVAVHVIDQMVIKMVVQLLNQIKVETQVLMVSETLVVMVHGIVTHLTEHKVVLVVVPEAQAVMGVKTQLVQVV